jgi:hypothetical protein
MLNRSPPCGARSNGACSTPARSLAKAATCPAPTSWCSSADTSGAGAGPSHDHASLNRVAGSYPYPRQCAVALGAKPKVRLATRPTTSRTTSALYAGPLSATKSQRTRRPRPSSVASSSSAGAPPRVWRLVAGIGDRGYADPGAGQGMVGSLLAVPHLSPDRLRPVVDRHDRSCQHQQRVERRGEEPRRRARRRAWHPVRSMFAAAPTPMSARKSTAKRPPSPSPGRRARHLVRCPAALADRRGRRQGLMGLPVICSL